ncbi:50S ribosomal protein L29 [Ancylothrix sp. C2]|uniref:50S ribosomal protein L29 n=1 Tax=Ancylothrix sp. D3o TaxID=2953691 RepID=UPI0021BAE500|nr:50S ribosomal protein L29 [Ancylothrix sp. D3o]MCT7949205.1 50S ribosomal protein L29 [Ancylothrix sp. D3o]
MAFSKISDFQNLSDSEVEQQILAAKRELFQLRMQKATKQLEKPHLFKHTKHRLAQLHTLEAQRKQKAAQES